MFLVTEFGADEDDRNNFQVTHVPSSMSHQLVSFLDSLSQQNIHEKLDELQKLISIPDPQAVMSCGLDKVQDWYVGLPGLSEKDFIADDKMDRWVTVLYGSGKRKRQPKEMDEPRWGFQQCTKVIFKTQG